MVDHLLHALVTRVLDEQRLRFSKAAGGYFRDELGCHRMLNPRPRQVNGAAHRRLRSLVWSAKPGA